MKYYRLTDELNKPQNRWFLKSLNVVDANKISVWDFVMPRKLEFHINEHLTMSIRESGIPLDFTFADFDIPIINEKAAFFLNENECQLIPVKIDGIKNEHSYFVTILLNVVDCVDENRSNFEKWEINNPIRPEKAGEYKSIYDLHLDVSKIRDSAIFRLAKYESVIIINEELKEKLEKANVTGVKFKDVS